MTSDTLEEKLYSISDKEIRGSNNILTPEAIAFVCKLQEKFGSRRLNLLTKRETVQLKIDQGNFPDFLNETKSLKRRTFIYASFHFR